MLALALPLAAHDLFDAGPAFQILHDLSPAPNSGVRLQHQVRNASEAEPGPVEIKYWLSANTTPAEANDHLLHTETVPNVTLGRPVELDVELKIPSGLGAGPWRLIWVIDTRNDTKPANNTVIFGSVLTLGVPSSFDLADDGVFHHSISPTSLAPGASFQVGARVRNLGPDASAGFKVEYRLSINTTIGDGDDVLLGSVAKGGLDAPGSHAISSTSVGRTLGLPGGLAPGTYRLGYRLGYRIVVPDDAAPGNNTVLFADKLFVTAPPAGSIDLTDAGSAFHGLLPWENVLRGGQISVSGAVRNLGTTVSGTFNLTFFASLDGTLGNSDDVFLGTMQVDPVLPNINGLQIRSFTKLLPVTALAANLPYRIGWAISGGGDGNPTNNLVLPGPAIRVIEPSVELLPGWAVGGERVAHDGSRFEFSGSIHNPGTQDRLVDIYAEFAGSKTAAGWLGDASHVDGVRRPENTRGRFLVRAGETRALSCLLDRMEITGPVGVANQPGAIRAGSYAVTLYLVASSGSVEELEDRGAPVATGRISGGIDQPEPPPAADSLAIPGTVVVRDIEKADLACSAPVLVTGQAQPGGQVTIGAFSVWNAGSKASGATTLRYHLNGTAVGPSFSLPALERRSSSVPIGPHTFTLPAGTPWGEGRFTVTLDPADVVDEDAEFNNTRDVTGALAIGPLPDLYDAGEAFRFHPSAVSPGEKFTLQIRIRNGGLAAAGPFQVRFYLSPGPVLDLATAQVLATTQVGGLAALANLPLTSLLTMPPGTASGIRHLIWHIDHANAVVENTETNNITVSRPVHLGPGVNLRMGSTPIAPSVSHAQPGDTFTLTGSRANTGNQPAGAHQNVLALYRVNESGNFQFFSALDIRQIPDGGTPAGADIPFSYPVTLVPAVTVPGEYWLGYNFDYFGTVPEVDGQDNRVMLPAPFVILPAVAPGSPATPPVILDFRLDGNDVFLEWTSYPGMNYRLERATNPLSWENAAPLLPGAAGRTSAWFLDQRAPERPTGLFRIRQIE
jgi:hypothetical protein